VDQGGLAYKQRYIKVEILGMVCKGINGHSIGFARRLKRGLFFPVAGVVCAKTPRTVKGGLTRNHLQRR
jgi:hypothetical protein